VEDRRRDERAVAPRRRRGVDVHVVAARKVVGEPVRRAERETAIAGDVPRQTKTRRDVQPLHVVGALAFREACVARIEKSRRRVDEHLTLHVVDEVVVVEDVGARWEPYLGQQMLYGGANIFNHDNFINNVKSQVFVNAPAGLLYPGDAGFPKGKSAYNVKWLDVSPRLGLAWDVTGNGRLAFRTSYGLTYDFPSGDYMNINASAPPWGNRSLITTTTFDDPYAIVGGNPHPIATNKNTVYPAFGAFGVMDPDINPPRVQSWNVTLEKQLGTNWAATVNYLGRYSDHLWAEEAINPGVFMGLAPCTINGVAYPVCSTLANLNQRRKFSLENPTQGALLGFVDEHNDVGWQKYNGLRFTGTRRSANGLTFSGNYTFSHCVGTATPGSFPQIASGYTNPDNPDMDKGHCDQDRTHLANITAGFQTPDFSNKVAHTLASNWRVTGIYTARSGLWLNITTGQDNALNGQLQQRP